MLTKFFIGGFPIDANELELARLLGPFGNISTIKIIRNRKTGICKGYAFIEMTDRSAAENAISALHDTELEGRVLSLRIVEDEKAVTSPVELNRPDRPVKIEQNGADETKRKRPRKTQFIQANPNWRERENFA